MINGVTQLVMTKADVLDSLEELEVCNMYKVNGVNTKQIPFQMQGMNIEPVYEKFKGWKIDITSIKEFNKIPAEMKTYISYINEALGVPVKFISNGPGSDQIIMAS